MSEVPLYLYHPLDGSAETTEGRGVRLFRKWRVQGYLTYKKKHPPLGPYRRPMPRVLGGSEGGGRFLMGEVPL